MSVSRLFGVLLLASTSVASAQPQPAWTPISAQAQRLANAIDSDRAPSGDVYVIQFDHTASFRATVGRWNGTTWTQLPIVLPRFTSRITVTDTEDAIYVVSPSMQEAENGDGTVVQINGVGRYDIAAQTWDNLNGGLNESVIDLDVDPAGNLIIVGEFVNAADGTPLNHVARWNHGAGQWEALGGGLSDRAIGVALNDTGTQVVVSGAFESAFDAAGGPGKAAAHIAVYDYSSGQRQAIGNSLGAGAGITRVLFDGHRVVAIGYLPANGAADYVARWDGTAWSILASETNLSALPLRVERDGEGNLYVLGYASGQSYVHAYDSLNATWTQIASSGSLGTFASIAASPSVAGASLFLSGVFSSLTLAGGGTIAANNFAVWNGTTWTNSQPTFTGVNGVVNAVEQLQLVPPTQAASLRRAVAVGGDFSRLGNVPANKIAVWDGDKWDPLGFGVTDRQGVVNTVLESQNTIEAPPRVRPLPTPFIIGGRFAEVSDGDGTRVPTNGIAEWRFDSQTWRSLGQGVTWGSVPGSGTVYALAYSTARHAHNGARYVYVGGDFDTATNSDGTFIRALNIARFNLDTDRWENVERGTNGPVTSLEVFDGRRLGTDNPVGDGLWDHILIVGGGFTAAISDAGTEVSDTGSIAWLDGDGDWKPVFKGINGVVHAIDGMVTRRVSGGREGTADDEIVDFSVYIGGSFQSVNSPGPQVPASNLVKWTLSASAWNILGKPFGQASQSPGNGVNGVVRSVQVIPDLFVPGPDGLVTVAVGGEFTEAYDTYGNTVAAPYAALLRDHGSYLEPPHDDGSEFGPEEFQALGGGTDGAVYSIGWTSCLQNNGFFSSTYYVGGRFGQVGGNRNAPGLAKWREYKAPPNVHIVHAGSSGGGSGANSRVRGQVTGPQSFTCLKPALGKRSGYAVDLGLMEYGQTATLPKVVLPVGVPIAITVSDESGTPLSAPDTVVIASLDHPVVLAYTGVLDPSAVQPNPDGRDIGVSVKVVQMAGKELLDPGEGLLSVLHGVADASALSVSLSDGTVVADSVRFNDIGPAIVLTAGTHTLTVRRHSDNSTVGTFSVDVADAEVVVATLGGFLDPTVNADGPALGMIPISVTDEITVGVDENPRNSGPHADAELVGHPPYPNPFSGDLTVPVVVPEPVDAIVGVYDMLGRRVAVIHNGQLASGRNELVWNGAEVTAGVYLVRIRSGNAVVTRRAVKH